MTSTLASLTTLVASHAAATGAFDQVQGAEFVGAPGNGLSCAVWVNRVTAIPSSGLNVTSVRVELMVQLYHNAFAEPPEMIDPALLDALDVLWADYIGDFTLGAVLRQVDVKGAHGGPLDARAAYLTIGSAQGQGTSGRTYRVMAVTLPLIVDDLYVEAP